MDDLILAVAEWALTGVLGGVAMLLLGSLKRLRQRDDERERHAQTERDALKRGMQMMLRSELITLHSQWIAAHGYMPVEIKGMWMDMYRAYEALGSNGVIEGLYDDVRTAHVAPERGESQSNKEQINGRP